ncbi:MAG: hypothetical protein R2789_07910 [Microthrixaceae bacterium]
MWWALSRGGTQSSRPRGPREEELLDRHDLEVTTMGRRCEEDLVFFEAATAAAGQLAAALSSDRPPTRPRVATWTSSPRQLNLVALLEQAGNDLTFAETPNDSARKAYP